MKGSLIGAAFMVVLSAHALASGSMEESFPGGDRRLAALRLLHDGRFDEAEEVLESSSSTPADPSIAFFRAFVIYWRLLYDEGNQPLQRTFEERLEAAIRAAENAQHERPKDPEPPLWAGSSHLLLAQLRASQKKPFAAAVEARRTRRDLEVSRKAGGSGSEPLFGLGTYNYMADRVPAFVKGVRFLLFLPGGNREEGLDQLGQAASESRYFALEARLLLTTIYANKHERLYEEAVRQSDLAGVLAPDAIAVLHASAVLSLSLGRLTEAVRFLDRALDRAASAQRTDISVVATLLYQRARSEFGLFRPDLTLERLRPMIAYQNALPRAVRGEAWQLACDAAALSGTPNWFPELALALHGSTSPSPRSGASMTAAASAWQRALPALEIERTGGIESSAKALLELADSPPREPVVALLAGRALLLAGRGEEALRWLQKAESSFQLPSLWVGPCRLMAGRAADLAGSRPRAVQFYKKAQEGASFIGREAAYQGMVRPFRLAP